MALFLLCFSGLLSVFFLPTRLKPINMLKQIISYGGFHRIENKVDPFPTGKLCGGDKVTVAISKPIRMSTPFWLKEMEKSDSVKSEGAFTPRQISRVASAES